MPAKWLTIAAILAIGAAPATQPTSVPADHLLAPDDQVQLHVENVLGGKRIDARVYVDDSGALLPPMLHSAVRVKGLSAEDAGKAATAAYRKLKSSESASATVTLLKVAQAPSPNGPKLAAGDLVHISIAELAAPGVTTTLDLHVDDDGNLPLPLVKPVRAAGLSSEELVQATRRAYHATHLINRADVTVEKVEEPSRITAGPINVGDRIRIRMWDVEGPGMETTKDAEIGADGQVTLPLIGQLKLAGRTEGGAANEIQRAFRDANLVQNMIVTVRRTGVPEPL